VIPFSAEHAALMRVGESFETDGVLPGVSADKTIWKVVSMTNKAGSPHFYLEARYCGVYFGTFTFHRGKLAQEKLA